MSNHRVYIGAAFVAGVVVALSLKELFDRARRRPTPGDYDADLINSVRHGPPAIVDGVEGCIGNTPLIRIKSLSEATGCEILAKAEVWFSKVPPPVARS